MSYGSMIGRSGWGVVGSCLVVDKGRLSMCNMLVVDCSYRSSMVDLVVVGSYRGSDDGRLVAMADTSERATNSVGCVEIALRTDQGSQAGADKQNRLQSKSNSLSNNCKFD